MPASLIYKRVGGVPHVFVAALLVGGFVGLMQYEARNRSLVREVAELRSERDEAVAREKELSAGVARTYRRITAAEDELETLRFQFAAVEMQLDGVEYLSRALREELELPAAAADTDVDGTAPVGGALTPESKLSERIEAARVRLASGLSDLYGLEEQVSAQRAAELALSAGTAPTTGVAESRTSGPISVRTLAPTIPPANWPARGSVTSDFGWRNFGGRRTFHTGIDVSMPPGSQVLATGTGTVVGSGWQPGYGWCVLVQHSAGYNTLYAHLAEPIVKVGDPVESGTPVGLSGSSGNSTGPHLHYEVWKDGRVLDPRPLMDGTGGASGG